MKRLFFLLNGLLCILSCTSQKQGKGSSTVFALVDSQQYQFVARQMQPQSGRSQIVNGTYFLQVTKDQVVSDLPYIGRAFSAPIGTNDSGLRFTAKDFEYSVKEGKKESKEITIRPRDGGDTREMNMTIFSNGSADLRVTSNNRQPISFTGEVTAIPKKKQ